MSAESSSTGTRPKKQSFKSHSRAIPNIGYNKSTFDENQPINSKYKYNSRTDRKDKNYNKQHSQNENTQIKNTQKNRNISLTAPIVTNANFIQSSQFPLHQTYFTTFQQNAIFHHLSITKKYLIDEHQKKIAKLEKNISLSKNDGIKDVFKIHLKLLEQKKKSYIDFVEKLQIEKDKTSLEVIQKEIDINNSALKDNTWISAYRMDILNMINDCQTLIINGDINYGKSSRLPLYMNEKYSRMGKIVSCHQNSISAMNFASMAAKYYGQKVGEKVGYKLGKDIKTSEQTHILFTTSYYLLKETIKSPYLSQYSCIIIDDCHDISIETDIFLLKVKEIIKQRSDFKLILTGTFGNVDKYKEFFKTVSSACVLTLPSITFPVNLYYYVLQDQNKYLQRALELATSIHHEKKKGNILIFLATSREMKTGYQLLCMSLGNEVEYFILDNNLNMASMKNLYIFSNKQKVIFATNSMEYFQFPNISYVIDCGRVKEKVYCADKQQSVVLSSLISLESAERRKKLAGQIQGSICYRLYTEKIYKEEMIEKIQPSILKLDPTELIVMLLHYKISDPVNTNFINALNKQLLKTGILQLEKYGAIKQNCLTPLGESMANIHSLMSVPLQHSKLISKGIKNGLGFETVVIAMISSLNIPIFITSKQSENTGKLKFSDLNGDYFAILNVYSIWKRHDTPKKWCEDNGISHCALLSLDEKVKNWCATLKITAIPDSKLHNFLIELIAECFCDNLCIFTGYFKAGYRSYNSQRIFHIHSSSVLSYATENFPQYIVYDYIKFNPNSENAFMVNITPLSKEIVERLVKKKYISLITHISDKNLVPTVIEHIGTMCIKQVLLGKQGKKLDLLQNEIKKQIGCEIVLVVPNIECGSVVIYSYPEYSENIKHFISKCLKETSEQLQSKEETVSLTTGNASIKMVWGQGAIVKNISEIAKKSDIEDVTIQEELNFNLLHRYSINLTWRRRTCKGIGFITFNCSNDFEIARLHLSSGEIQVCDKNAKISVSRKASNQFYVEDLEFLTTNDDLKKAVEKILPSNIKLSATTVLIQPFSTSPEEIEIMKNELLLIFSGHLQYGNLDIEIEIPNSTDIFMKVYLNFSDAEDINVILNAIKLFDINFQQIPLNAIEVYRTTLICPTDHYNSVKNLIEEISKVTLKVDHKKDSTQLIMLSNEYNIMKEAEIAITKILQGRALEGFRNNQLRKLFSHFGQQWLKQISKITNSYIIQNFNTRTLRICGTDKNYEEIKCKIEDYLKNAENEIVSVISIGQGNLNRSIIRNLVQTYGAKLDGFLEECGLTSLELTVRYGQLTLYGTLKSIEKANEILEKLSATNPEEKLSMENREICPVCLMVPTSGYSYRMEYCGHNYCSDCAKLLVAEKNLPLQCCKEECQKELVIDDIENILEGVEKEREQLKYQSLKMYVQKNHNYVKFCPTPDCNVIYDLRSLKSNEWTCLVCAVTVCANCNCKTHPGMTCEMAQELKKDSDYSLKVWLSMDPTKRKICPICHSPIEKNGGCNHMTCWKCKSHLCWLCLQVFNNSNDVYDHMPYCKRNRQPFV